MGFQIKTHPNFSKKNLKSRSLFCPNRVQIFGQIAFTFLANSRPLFGPDCIQFLVQFAFHFLPSLRSILGPGAGHFLGPGAVGFGVLGGLKIKSAPA